MAEEKQIEEKIIRPQLRKDDIDTLRYVLEHVPGTAPSSLSMPEPAATASSALDFFDA